MGKTEKKAASRFLTVFLMALFVAIISVWALIQTISYARNGNSAPVTLNNTAKTVLSSPYVDSIMYGIYFSFVSGSK